jgi:gamma-glutamylcyclotransferase (GGCT)/AIG2-like uncharacterized protein YtfP
MTQEPGWVTGVILGFESPQAFVKLDQLEGFQGDRSPSENEYNRLEIEVFDPQSPPRSLGTVWTYYMSRQRVSHYGGIWLREGVWHEDQLPQR